MTSQDRPNDALWSPASGIDDPTAFDPNDPTAVDPMMAGADDGEVEVEVIVAQIEETRGDLSETIDEIGRRLEPGNVAREAGETVRTAATRKVDDMTTGIQDTWTDVRRGDASGIVDTIKSNPIPAAMVALGIYGIAKLYWQVFAGDAAIGFVAHWLLFAMVPEDSRVPTDCKCVEIADASRVCKMAVSPSTSILSRTTSPLEKLVIQTS